RPQRGRFVGRSAVSGRLRLRADDARRWFALRVGANVARRCRMRTPTLSTRARLSLAIVAAGFVFGVMTNGQSLGDASTYVLMTDSLLNDGDLVYAHADYDRAAALHFESVPQGLILTRHDWGYGYGKSFVYPAIAVP